MSKKNYTFLVVEDNLLMLKLVVNMLADIGYQDVVTARNGKEAWEKIQSPDTEIDLIVSDMLMPEEDGVQLLQRIRNSEEYWHLPFIMVTCVDDLDRIMSVTEQHIDGYLVKPVTEAALKPKIYSALKKAYDPDPYHRALYMGRKYLREGRLELAIQALAEARNLDPSQAATYFYLAETQEKVGKMDEAEENYKRCQDTSNDLYVKSLDGLSRVYQHKGETAKAMAVLKKAIDISPSTPDRHVDLAVQLNAMGNTEEAKSSLSTALKLSKKEANLPHKYVEACLDCGMDTEAETTMKRNMNRGTAEIVLLNQMGIVCRRRKEFDRARGYYERALQIAPTDESLNYNYAVLLVDLKEYEGAKGYLKRVLRQNPNFENAEILMDKLEKLDASRGD
ncbi:MAG: tetratricopeptide repeat protein [Proteobacteria bacterium]|nr:tetratricopeptide repeat protein [Pseudomonadota bacterium]